MTRTAPNDARCVVWGHLYVFFFFRVFYKLTSIFSYYLCLGRMEWSKKGSDDENGPLVSVVFFLSGFFHTN